MWISLDSVWSPHLLRALSSPPHQTLKLRSKAAAAGLRASLPGGKVGRAVAEVTLHFSANCQCVPLRPRRPAQAEQMDFEDIVLKEHNEPDTSSLVFVAA
jgi:hypothetical protein